jgi:formylglycine-generating enzyme required for sulfatase activity
MSGFLQALFGSPVLKRPRDFHPWIVPELDLEMIWINAGSFTMGSPESEEGRSEGETIHVVKLTRGFWLGKYQVTQGHYEALTGTNPSQYKTAGLDAPVERVSWAQASEFCAKLSARERAAKRLPAGYEYALPTEAQWEYACRAGTSGAYGGSGVLGDMGWYYDNCESKSEQPVGKKRPNAWDLYDMHGNVCEWCADWMGPYQKEEAVDPTGPKTGSAKILRGGSYCSIPRYCRSAIRFSDYPSSHQDDLGFRLSLRPVKA